MKRFTGYNGSVRVVLFAILLAATGNTAFTQPTEIEQKRHHAWGFDVMISESGIGAGGFFWKELSPTFSGFISLSISQAKDPNEVEMVEWFTGQQVVPGKINRFLVIPLHVGIQYRLFKDQIMDNFRPFLSAGLGPSMIYASPYQDYSVDPVERYNFFRALGYGRAYHTVSGFIGIGAYIGSDGSNLMGINFRYYYVPYFSGITSMIDFERSTSMDDLHFRQLKQFGGFYITFSFGMLR